MKIRLISLFIFSLLLASCAVVENDSEEIAQASATIDAYGADFSTLISQMDKSSTYLIYRGVDGTIHSTLSGSVDRIGTELPLSKSISTVILSGEVLSVWKMTSSRYVFETKDGGVVILKDLTGADYTRGTQVGMIGVALSNHSNYLILRKCNRDICKTE